MSNIHAKRIGKARWAKARKRSDHLAVYGPEDYPKSDPKCSDGFCGPRSQFDGCVSKISADDWFKPLFKNKP